jgi:hypothetical protein
MSVPIENAPLVGFDAELSVEQRADILAQLHRASLPPSPVPTAALHLLYEAACGDTGSSQAARHFLFWLAGQPDPTGYEGFGGLELRRLDRDRKEAAWEILHWWTGPTQSDEPLYGLLTQLRRRFA